VNQGQNGIVNDNVAAARVQCQVQQQQNQHLLPHQRSPVPMTKPVAMPSSCTQAACSDSHSSADVYQVGSSLPGSGIFCSGSAMSLTSLS
jgi:hypothetical protein